jgi:trehalose 6-phosphate phosphatase
MSSGDEQCRTAQYDPRRTINQPQNRICEKNRYAPQIRHRSDYFTAQNGAMHNRRCGRSAPSGVYRLMVNLPPLPRPGDRWALFLDVDGTLVAIAPTPAAVRVEPALLPLLQRLSRASDGALALVSGRSLSGIDTLFRPLLLPAAGLHGWERRRADGTLAPSAEPTTILAPLRPRLSAFVANRPGLLLEDKGGSLAIHYRLAPHYGAVVCQRAREIAAADPQLRLIEGRKVVEFVPRGSDKGQAIAEFLAEPPFAGRVPIYVGDDTTDEDGFAAVNRLDGLSIKVANPEARGRVGSQASYRLPSVAALHGWLAAVAERLDPAQTFANAERTERQSSVAR